MRPKNKKFQVQFGMNAFLSIKQRRWLILGLNQNQCDFQVVLKHFFHLTLKYQFFLSHNYFPRCTNKLYSTYEYSYYLKTIWINQYLFLYFYSLYDREIISVRKLSIFRETFRTAGVWIATISIRWTLQFHIINSSSIFQACNWHCQGCN